jgi:hypothetical protein
MLQKPTDTTPLHEAQSSAAFNASIFLATREKKNVAKKLCFELLFDNCNK